MSELTGWENAYREQGDFQGPPPWNIGEPQPELAAVIRAGKVRSEVLDAGCGHAELSLALAADGYTVHGIDMAPTAIAAATTAAADRGLRTAFFHQADITTFTGFAGRFNTVIDSALFHTLPSSGATAICVRYRMPPRPAPASTFWRSPRAPSRLICKPRPSPTRSTRPSCARPSGNTGRSTRYGRRSFMRNPPDSWGHDPCTPAG
jgi:SAM-dependent methyltransferase